MSGNNGDAQPIIEPAEGTPPAAARPWPVRTHALEPAELRPLHATLESAGAVGALRRLWAQLRAEPALAPLLARSDSTRPPAWLVGAFAQAAAACDPARAPGARERALELVSALRRTAAAVAAHRAHWRANARTPPPPPLPPPLPPPPPPPPSPSPEATAALARLCLGELLEAYAALRGERICAPNEVPCTAAQQAEMARLCEDAHLAALWTSAHAEYLALGTTLFANESDDNQDTAEAALPHPELGLLVCTANAPDQTALLERALSPRACAKEAQPMLALLQRATNAGSRGWESTLSAGVRDSDGVARVCAHAAAAAFAGLHPCLHPAARAPWAARLAAARTCRVGQSTADVRELAERCPGALKEVVRLYLATLLAEDAASRCVTSWCAALPRCRA